MHTKLDQTATWLHRLMLALFLLVCCVTLLLGITQRMGQALAFGLALLSLLLVRFLLPPIVKAVERLGYGKSLLLLAVVCFAVKLIWVILVQVPPSGDYAVFWGYANSLAEREVIFGGRYMALFPHIFGYSSFLSGLIRLFGAHALLAQVVNVCLTVCSGIILFRLCWRWLHLRAAISVFLFWIVCPSQTMYNSFVLSEPFYTTLMLAFLLLVTELSHRTHSLRRPVAAGVIAGIAGGILLRFVQGARPIAVIWVISLVIWLLCFQLPHLAGRGFRRVWLSCVVVLVLVYTVSGSFWDAALARRIGEPPAATPGYSILVGFNQSSDGRWNQEDSDRLYSYSNQPDATAQWAQEQVMADAVERISSGHINFPRLFAKKLRIFMGADNSCVSYSASVLRHTQVFSLACNLFYYLTLLLAVGGAVRLWKRRTVTTVSLVPLYTLGLVMAQMLVEVAGRYHYSIVPMLLLMGQAALFSTESGPMNPAGES